MKKRLDEYSYFGEFEKNSNYILESAELLKSTLENYTKEKLEENISKVHKLENAADKTLHQMRNYLIKDFLPPIDREDIIVIAHRIDDLEDCIDELLINFNILNINSLREDSKEFAELLLKCCKTVKEIIVDFKNFKKADSVKTKVIEINELEEKADRLFERVMKKLYQEEKDPIEITKWTTIYNCFENTTDACEKIGDEIEDIIMKNS